MGGLVVGFGFGAGFVVRTTGGAAGVVVVTTGGIDASGAAIGTVAAAEAVGLLDRLGGDE